MSELMLLKVSKPSLRSKTLFVLHHDLMILTCDAMKSGEDEVPIFVDNKLYHIHFSYSKLLCCMIPHLMVAEGEYKGFIGPQLRDGFITVTREAFDKHFWVNMYKHGTTTAGDPVVWEDTVQTLATVRQRIRDGWLINKPAVKELEK